MQTSRQSNLKLVSTKEILVQSKGECKFIFTFNFFGKLISTGGVKFLHKIVTYRESHPL